MQVQTKAYGTIDVDEAQRISFPTGLFGFEAFKDYVLIDAEQQPFYWLQSVDSSQAAFVLISPFLFRPDYEITGVDDDLASIGVTSPEDVLVFAIVTIHEDGPMTANLLGPLLINKKNRAGCQTVLQDSRWKTKHDIGAELRDAELRAAELHAFPPAVSKPEASSC